MKAADLVRLSTPTPGAGPWRAAAAAERLGWTLARAQAGDTVAFRDLVCSQQASILSLAMRMLGTREDAQELAQDVFVLLHRHLAKIESVSHLSAWLRKSVCHRAIDRLRGRARHVFLPLESADGHESSERQADPLLERQLRRLVATLPPTPRAVVLLRYQEDLDPPEISAVLGLPLNTVKSHLRRSLSLMRSRCGGDAGTDSHE